MTVQGLPFWTNSRQAWLGHTCGTWLCGNRELGLMRSYRVAIVTAIGRFACKNAFYSFSGRVNNRLLIWSTRKPLHDDTELVKVLWQLHLHLRFDNERTEALSIFLCTANGRLWAYSSRHLKSVGQAQGAAFVLSLSRMVCGLHTLRWTWTV